MERHTVSLHFFFSFLINFGIFAASNATCKNFADKAIGLGKPGFEPGLPMLDSEPEPKVVES